MPSIAALLPATLPHRLPASRWLAAALLLLLAGRAPQAQAQLWATRPAAALAEARTERAEPSLSGHVRDIRRVTGYLADALCLSTAQQIALQHCTVAERADLLLATSDQQAQAALARYLAAVRRVLVSSQLRLFMQLREQLDGTLLPLDGLGLASL